ncbi:recombinase family protein [Specibacter cremeus]|uniref:recombinase family protein n=1 Tax=Specibacter cremeus TaxID=1629051 RepID=UPI0030B81F01
MPGLLIGYARVSTNDHDLTAQKNALAALAVTPKKTPTGQGRTGASRARPGLGVGVPGSRLVAESSVRPAGDAPS